MSEHPPTDPHTDPPEPLLCFECGYNLSGLRDDETCPECGTSIASTIENRRDYELPPESLHSAGVSGIWCVRCNYDLSGLQTDSVCPECGAPVERSLHGDRLLYSSPDYLAKLHTGVFLIETGIALLLISMFLMVAVGIFSTTVPMLQAPGIGFFGEILGMGMGLISLVGWWLFSSPDPAIVGTRTGSQARTVVRVTIVISTVILLFKFVIYLLPLAATLGGIGVLGLIEQAAILAFAVRFFAAMLYIRWLAPRIPNERVDKRAALLMWLGPVLVVLGCGCFFLTVIVALVMYWVLLDWIRNDLKAIRSLAETQDLQ